MEAVDGCDPRPAWRIGRARKKKPRPGTGRGFAHARTGIDEDVADATVVTGATTGSSGGFRQLLAVAGEKERLL
jgi:hypothetical protein